MIKIRKSRIQKKFHGLYERPYNRSQMSSYRDSGDSLIMPGENMTSRQAAAPSMINNFYITESQQSINQSNVDLSNSLIRDRIGAESQTSLVDDGSIVIGLKDTFKQSVDGKTPSTQTRKKLVQTEKGLGRRVVAVNRNSQFNEKFRPITSQATARTTKVTSVFDPKASQSFKQLNRIGTADDPYSNETRNTVRHYQRSLILKEYEDRAIQSPVPWSGKQGKTMSQVQSAVIPTYRCSVELKGSNPSSIQNIRSRQSQLQRNSIGQNNSMLIARTPELNSQKTHARLMQAKQMEIIKHSQNTGLSTKSQPMLERRQQ